MIGKICNALALGGYKPVTELKFCDTRRFRFDIALPEHKIAIEYEGGIFTGGRHTNGVGYARDCEKYNLATIQGWRVLRYNTKSLGVKNGEFLVLEDVNKLLKA